MQNDNQDKYEFISEKIKEKPVNRKKFLSRICYVILMAIVFGIVASVVFVLVEPRLEERINPREDPSITIPKDEPEAETDTESQEKNETVKDEPDQELQVIYEQLTLEDYQVLQNQLYAIGKQANKFVVGVTGVKSNTDWFNNSYESKGQGSGIIIADNGQELLILTERKVISGASSIYVTFVDDASTEASIKSYDANTGITILSVPVSAIDESNLDCSSWQFTCCYTGNACTCSRQSAWNQLLYPDWEYYIFCIYNIYNRCKL